MQLTSLNDERTVKIIKSDEDLALLQKHLQEVIDGAAFRGSHRSGQFLKYVVEQAVAGHFDCLKERVIGVELFGRSPSYDTGGDAIVRVTASDVRKRLLQHYGRYGVTSQFRISLPSGSYIPEISRQSGDGANGNHEITANSKLLLPNHDAMSSSETSVASPASSAAISPAASTPLSVTSKEFSRGWLVLVLLATVLNLGVWGIVGKRANRSVVPAPASVLPWSVFFNSPRSTIFVTSDPGIAEIQQYVGGEISPSDYANHRLIPKPDNMTPEVQHFWDDVILRDDQASIVDAKIAVRIAELTQTYSKRIQVRAARNIQMADLQTDDNYILMGSPRSDPWSALFSNELDFRFTFDKSSGQEIISNLHPRPHEASQYIPTALGGATGQSYAIIAFVPNPDQNGQVLLLAGANAEGTQAAGKLITDVPRFSEALRECGISPTGPLKHFELLLKLNTMAGSPNDAHIEACHILTGGSARM
jgi:hypothetical protein